MPAIVEDTSGLTETAAPFKASVVRLSYTALLGATIAPGMSLTEEEKDFKTSVNAAPGVFDPNLCFVKLKCVLVYKNDPNEKNKNLVIVGNKK